MYLGLLLKFTQHSDLKERLLDTHNLELIEGNNWDDTYWGICNGRGRNMLGMLLMEVRDILKLGIEHTIEKEKEDE